MRCWEVADFFFYCFRSLFWEAAAAAKIGEIKVVGEFYRLWFIVMPTGDCPKWLFWILLFICSFLGVIIVVISMSFLPFGILPLSTVVAFVDLS